MAYTVVVADSIERDLKGVPKKDVERIWAAIHGLAENPRPHGCKAMKGNLKGLLRVRSGDYRILYRVEDGKLLVEVIEVGNRRDVYD